MTTEKELIQDLGEMGVRVSSIWDLVNGPNNYSKGLPILLRHLESAEDYKLKEGIIRALGVKEFSFASHALIKEFKNQTSQVDKWAIGNTLSIIATKEILDDLIEIMSDKSYGADRQMIAEALGKIGDKKSVPILLKSLEDDSVAGHVIEALGKIADDMLTVEKIKPFKKSKEKWIRTSAKMAINRIKKRYKGYA